MPESRFLSPGEAAPYYFTYIDRVASPDVLKVLESQWEPALALFSSIPEERSLYRYAPDKWSIRQVLSHINDTERVFLHRAFWFGRGFGDALPSFDQEVAIAAAEADRCPLASHIRDFRAVRESALTFFSNLPADAWGRTGTASGHPVSVRALAFIIAGHLEHHLAVLRERYGV
jgi:uncharacterized damage-inducible protein DinB